MSNIIHRYTYSVLLYICIGCVVWEFWMFVLLLFTFIDSVWLKERDTKIHRKTTQIFRKTENVRPCVVENRTLIASFTCIVVNSPTSYVGRVKIRKWKCLTLFERSGNCLKGRLKIYGVPTRTGTIDRGAKTFFE